MFRGSAPENFVSIGQQFYKNIFDVYKIHTHKRLSNNILPGSASENLVPIGQIL
jgi:hypothetical protein